MPLSQTFVPYLDKLEAGNRQFLDQLESKKDLSVSLNPESLRQDQRPFSVVVTCSDSRVIPELIFSQSFGDLFVVRLAGNTINSIALASIEYAALTLGVSFCVVLGHSMCGAVKAAADFMKTHTSHASHNLRDLVSSIVSPLDEKFRAEGKNLETQDLLGQHIKMTVNRVQTESSVIQNLVKDDRFFVTGALYDLNTGRVTFA